METSKQQNIYWTKTSKDYGESSHYAKGRTHKCKLKYSPSNKCGRGLFSSVQMFTLKSFFDLTCFRFFLGNFPSQLQADFHKIASFNNSFASITHIECQHIGFQFQFSQFISEAKLHLKTGQLKNRTYTLRTLQWLQGPNEKVLAYIPFAAYACSPYQPVSYNLKTFPF